MQTTAAAPAAGRARRQPVQPVGARELAGFAHRMSLPAAGQIKLERAVRWSLVAASVGLLLLGINP